METINFQLIAVIIMITFYGCYFAKMITQKKQGVQTDQMGKGKTGFVKFVEITTKIAAILVVIAELVSIFTGTNQLSEIFIFHFFTLVQITGALISFIGTIVFITAVLTMRDSWRAGVPQTDKTELITNGIYRLSRNPAFLGFDLLYIGILLMFFNWILCILTVFAIVMYHLQIVNVEEHFLRTAFGNEYVQYRERVCRYLGKKR